MLQSIPGGTIFDRGINMEHKLILRHQTEKSSEWECPVCQRQVRLFSKGGGFEILKPGDQLANHGSICTVPELNLSQPAVDQISIH